jgi:hypothetical protein
MSEIQDLYDWLGTLRLPQRSDIIVVIVQWMGTGQVVIVCG